MLRSKAHVRLTVHDVTGRTVIELADGLQDVGMHSRVWMGTDASGGLAAPGVYFVRLALAHEVHTYKIVRAR
jgi:hypothetical protein